MNFVYVPATNGTNANAGFMVSDWMEDAGAERERARRGGTRWRQHASSQAMNSFASHLVTRSRRQIYATFICLEFLPPSDAQRCQVGIISLTQQHAFGRETLNVRRRCTQWIIGVCNLESRLEKDRPQISQLARQDKRAPGGWRDGWRGRASHA